MGEGPQLMPPVAVSQCKRCGLSPIMQEHPVTGGMSCLHMCRDSTYHLSQCKVYSKLEGTEVTVHNWCTSSASADGADLCSDA